MAHKIQFFFVKAHIQLSQHTMDQATLNELLECSVCMEQLDATSKVLPCQHTFCRQCLEEIYNTKNALHCPECRTLVTLRVDDLPPNILLIRLLESMKYAGTRAGGAGSSSPTPSGASNSPSRSGANTTSSRITMVEFNFCVLWLLGMACL